MKQKPHNPKVEGRLIQPNGRTLILILSGSAAAIKVAVNIMSRLFVEPRDDS